MDSAGQQPHIDQKYRSERLDFLRGLAILGMLVANVPWHAGNSMSRVIDPDLTSISAWLLQYLLFDSRFLPIFCFLFGAGFWILIKREDASDKTNHNYIKRMFVLFLIGVFHAYVFWPGDILITYSLCGCLLLLFRHCTVMQMFVWGCIFKFVHLLFGQWPVLYYQTIDAWLFAWWFDAGEAPLSAAQAYAGNYFQLFEYNAWRNQFLQWTALPYFRVWNALGLMLIGIALFRTGILQGDKTRKFYLKMLWISAAISTPLIVYGVIARIGINPSIGPALGFTETLPLYNLTFRAGCTVGSLTIIALINVGWESFSIAFRQLIQKVGKMALSNYLLQTLFFFLLFHTLKLFEFDTLDHDSMLLMVCTLWLVHLCFSHLWLNKFNRGPMENIYRYFSSK